MTPLNSFTEINVLKIGGGAGIDHTATLCNLAERVLAGERWVVVHGCSDLTNHLLEERGIPVQTITSPGGHTSRYTDARTIEVFHEAATTINQQIVETLTGFGVEAFGLADAPVISGERKTAIRAIRNGRPLIIRDDYSGKIMGVQGELLLNLLENGSVPVVAPLALGLEREWLNVDGDLVAAHIAREISAARLIILSNVAGLLRDICDPNSLISEFNLRELDRYEAFAVGRMKKKLLAAAEAQVPETILGDARTATPLDDALNGFGTHIIREGERERIHVEPQYA